MKTYDGGTLSGTTITGTPVAEQDWGLDALGNWGTYTQKASGSATLNQTRTHNTANEISAIGIASGGTGTDWIDPNYDLAGNRVTCPYPLSPNLSLTMTYDAWNRLVRVQLAGTIQIFAAEYDGLGRRIVRTDEGITRRSYYNESWQELEVRQENSGTESANPREQFVWHPYYLDALATRFYDATTGGTQVQHYFTHDANFNVTGALSTSAAVVERYDYSPYGEPMVLDANFDFDDDGTIDIASSRRYTGQRLDTETALYQYRNRYYHPRLGRFISRDPIGYEGSQWNLYEYVESRPTKEVDPRGLACKVFFRCTLTANILNGCTRTCNYLCNETGRQNAGIGGVSCNEVPAGQIITSDTSNTSYLCAATNGLCGKPSDCGPPYDTSRVYINDNNIGDCSKASCRRGCESIYDGTSAGCELFKGTFAEQACIAAAEAAKQTCLDGCNSVCKNP